DTWELFAMSGVARPAAQALTELLERRWLAPLTRDALLAALPSYARWRPDTLDLDAAIHVASARADDAARDVMLREVIERLVTGVGEPSRVPFRSGPRAISHHSRPRARGGRLALETSAERLLDPVLELLGILLGGQLVKAPALGVMAEPEVA